MLNNISWQGYWATLAISTAFYYIWLYLKYFRNQFKIPYLHPSSPVPQAPHSVKSFLEESIVSDVPVTGPNLFGEEDSPFETPDKDSEEEIVYAFMNELNAYLENAKKQKCVKEEIIFSIQSILKKYPTLKTSQYKESISNVLVSECEHLCSIHLSGEDVVQVWLGR